MALFADVHRIDRVRDHSANLRLQFAWMYRAARAITEFAN